MRAAIAAGKSNATGNHVRKVLSAIFTYAIRMQCYSGNNPAVAVEALPEKPVRRVRVLSAGQFLQLWEDLKEPAKSMVLVAMCLSPNVSELLGLTERHLNFTGTDRHLDGEDTVPAHSIAIREHLYVGHRDTLKAKARYRNLPMPAELEQALRDLVESNKTRGPDAPVFQSGIGTPASAENLLDRVLQPAAARLRAKDISFPHVTWRGLRHSHATLTKDARMSRYDRMRLIGHQQGTITDDTYTHETPEDHARLRREVERVMAMIAGRAVERSKVVSIGG